MAVDLEELATSRAHDCDSRTTEQEETPILEICDGERWLNYALLE